MNKSIVLVFALMAVLIFGTIAYAKSTSTSDMEYARMEGQITACEETLDSIAKVIPFEDTVGEGDAYQDMISAHEAFYAESDDKALHVHYDLYMRSYRRVLTECFTLMQEKAKSEVRDSIEFSKSFPK